MGKVWEPIVTIATAIVGVAILAVLVSRNAQTPAVLAAAGGAFSNALSTAVSPVTGAASAPNVNAGSSGGFSGLPALGANPGWSGTNYASGYFN